MQLEQTESPGELKVRWLPPPADSHNGLILGYRLKAIPQIIGVKGMQNCNHIFYDTKLRACNIFFFFFRYLYCIILFVLLETEETSDKTIKTASLYAKQDTIITGLLKGVRYLE